MTSKAVVSFIILAKFVTPVSCGQKNLDFPTGEKEKIGKREATYEFFPLLLE